MTLPFVGPWSLVTFVGLVVSHGLAVVVAAYLGYRAGLRHPRHLKGGL